MKEVKAVIGKMELTEFIPSTLTGKGSHICIQKHK